MAKTVIVCSIDDVKDGEALRVDAQGQAVVLVRIGTSLYALEDQCSHEDYPLSQGLVDAESCEIECARHGAMFNLETGSACSLPAVKPVAVYEVAVVNDNVEVTLP